jgi:hypothetical protein
MQWRKKLIRGVPTQPHVRISTGIDLKSKGGRGTTWPTTAFYQVAENRF